MEISKKIDILLEQNHKLHESGVRDIKKIAKEYQKSKIFYHQDLDGITSGIAMREYLKQYGIKTVDVEDIQYGDKEYTVKKTPKGVMQVLVDFGHAKVNAKIYTDHHDHGDDERRTFAKGQSKSLPKTPSNVEAISMTMSPTDIFPTKDVKIISTVDTANFAKYGLTPDDIMKSVFTLDKKVDVSKNHQMMGLVVNKLVLAYKNKKGFLDELVMTAKPSLLSMYNTTVKLAKKYGYDTGKDMTQLTANYKQQRKDKSLPNLKVSDVKNMKGGDSGMIGTTIVQTGGGAMNPARGNQYDRYAIFSIYPESDYLVTEWPSMLNQVSKNPFVSKRNPHHLGDLVMKKIMPKYKGKLSKMMVSLDTLKYNFEAASMRKGGIEGIVAFTFDDLQYLFKDQLKKLADSPKWYKEMLHNIVNKPYKHLSPKQKAVMKKIEIPAWEIIMKQSGGHKDITNINLPHWLGKKGEMKKIQRSITMDTAKEMQDRHLE
jgi:hypothetical protein